MRKGFKEALIVLTLSLVIVLSCAKRPEYLEPTLSGDRVVVDIKGLKESGPVFYTLHHNGKRINFFVVKIKDDIQSYFDACQRCYPKKLGYRMSEEYVVCRACNMRHPLYSLETGIGSCYPIVLKGRVEGEMYIIDKEIIIAGSRFF